MSPAEKKCSTCKKLGLKVCGEKSKVARHPEDYLNMPRIVDMKLQLQPELQNEEMALRSSAKNILRFMDNLGGLLLCD